MSQSRFRWGGSKAPHQSLSTERLTHKRPFGSLAGLELVAVEEAAQRSEEPGTASSQKRPREFDGDFGASL